MSRFRTYPVLLFIFVLLLGGLLVVQRGRIPEAFSLSRDVPFEKISKAVRASDASLAVVFDSNKRIARLSENGELVYLISSSSSPEKGFYFANELTFGPDGSLYVASTYMDMETLTVNREAIVRFSARGHVEAVLYSFEHSSETYTDNIGLIRSLKWTPAGLRFCMLREEGVHSLLLDPESGSILSETVTPFEGARDRVIYATISDDGEEVAFSTAATEIFVASPPDGIPAKPFDGRELPTEIFSIPSDLHYLDRTLYFSDLGRDSIMRLVGTNLSEPLFNGEIAHSLGYADDFYECKYFQIAPGTLILPNHGKVVQFNTNPPASIQTRDRAQGNSMFWIQRVSIWAQLAAFLGALVALLVLTTQNASPDGRRMARQVSIVVLMLGAAVIITTYMIFNNMNHRLEEESTKNLRGYLEVGRIVVDVEGVDRIQHVKDYMNEDYVALLSQLQQAITREGKIDAGTYSGVYKIFGNKMTAVAYHDGLRGIFYPYDYQYDKSVYAKVVETGLPYVGEIVDIYGVWLNGVIPLVNKAGKTIGLLEVGVDQSAHRDANLALFKMTLIDLSMVLFVLLFIFTEIGFFSSQVLEAGQHHDEAALQRGDEGAIRFVSFLAITGVFLSASFLPLFSKSLAPAMGNVPFDVVIGLPMVIETLCGAVIALLYGHLRIRVGIKTDIVLGSLIVAAGMVGTALATTFVWLIAGRITVGMGMGLLMIAFRTYFLIEKNEGRKESGIIALTAGVVAGINTGSVSGGMLAARLGMKTVFFTQAGILVLAAVATLLLIRNRHRPTGSAAAAPFSPWTFLADRTVWSFFIFAFLPVTACGFFLGFLFPLFAESQGHTTHEISLAFMIFGVGSVYLGPSITRLTSHFFGSRRAMPVGALVMAGGLMVFAYFQTLAAAYATIILFSLTESFIFNQGMSYFSSLPGVRRFGEDKAMGVYNVFESSGEALGPISFGLAMSLGLGVGITSIAATLGICSVLFLALSRSAKKDPA